MMLTMYLNLMVIRLFLPIVLMMLTPSPWTPQVEPSPSLMETTLFPLMTPMMSPSCPLTPPLHLSHRPMTSTPRSPRSTPRMQGAFFRSSMTSAKSFKIIELILHKYRRRGRTSTRRIIMRKLTYLRINLDTPGLAMQEQNTEIMDL